MLKEGERLDYLDCGTLRIIQKKTGYNFTMDAVLLANFARALPGARVIDLGTGSGVIPILMSAKTKAKELFGIEIQERLAEMAMRSVALNRLEDRVHIILDDIKNAPARFGNESFDAVVSNPPYMPFAGGDAGEKTICRREVYITVPEVIGAAGKLLKYGGNFFMVMKADRLADVIYSMRAEKIEPKRILPVQPTPEKPVDTVLIEGKKCGKPGMILEKPLVVFDADGNYTAEIKRIYKQ